MTNLYAGSECCGAPLEEVGNHDTVDGRKCSVQICTECGKEYYFYRRDGGMKPVIRKLVEKVAREIDPDVEVKVVKIGADEDSMKAGVREP